MHTKSSFLEKVNIFCIYNQFNGLFTRPSNRIGFNFRGTDIFQPDKSTKENTECIKIAKLFSNNT